jgi:hypothetical protein
MLEITAPPINERLGYNGSRQEGEGVDKTNVKT